ncbi:MAG: hypothetical protein JWO32_1037 [Bacteroidetes bacterium]|nr:hypothetical protein [Bacteroidota bacterium]
MKTSAKFKYYNTWVRENSIVFKNLTDHRVTQEFLYSMSRLTKQFKHTHIKLDFTIVNSIYPHPTVPIAAYIEFFKQQGITFEIIGAPSYLINTSFNNPITPFESVVKSTHSFLDKIWTFSNSEEVYSLVMGIIKGIRRTIDCEVGVIESCEWGIYEIMDNVIQHSEIKKGFVMAQINKVSKSFNICVFDYGVGIYQTMKDSSSKPRNSVDAISLSVQEGKKGAKSIGQGNGMWGLYNIVNENYGHLNITSGTGAIHFKNKQATTFKDVIVLNFKNQATTINFHLNLNKETLLTNAIKGYTFVDLYVESFENDYGQVLFKIEDVSSGTGTRESAVAIRNELLNLYTATKKPVIIDFVNIGIISSSFADELIGKLIEKLGFFQYQQIFKLVNMNNTIQSILHRSIGQRFYEEYSKSMS